MNSITPVWNSNFFEEIDSLRLSLDRYKLLSLDTEFPGFVRDTPRDAPDVVIYNDLKFNVDSTNLIQLGVTLLDEEGNIGPTWEFNFYFDLEKETHVQSSIAFLKKTGLNFEKNKEDGIPRNLFRLYFLKMVVMRQDLKWVTFHGMYDLAYVYQLFIGEPMPNTAQEFAGSASSFFDCVFDLKLAAKHCEGLKEVEVGLAKLSRIMNVKRLGEAHNAGSDSLLTANVYVKLMKSYDFGDRSLEGMLYGLEDIRIGKMYKPLLEVPQPHPHPIPCGIEPQIPMLWHDAQPCYEPQIPMPWHDAQPCYVIRIEPPVMVMPDPHAYVILS